MKSDNDPMHPLSYSNAAGASMALGTFDEALSFLQRGYELSPDHGFLRRTEAITLALRGNVELAGRKLLEIGGVRALLGHAFAGDHASARRLALEAAEARPRDGEPIWVMAELGEATEVTRITRIIDTSPVAALSFLRLIYYSGGYICFDMKAAPNFRARLREAGIDPASLKPWVPLSKPKPKQAGERVKE